MIKTTNQYCLEILSLGVRHVKALANLVMALSSQKVSSVVELSESPVFHYQYSSIADAIHHILKTCRWWSIHWTAGTGAVGTFLRSKPLLTLCLSFVCAMAVEFGVRHKRVHTVVKSTAKSITFWLKTAR